MIPWFFLFNRQFVCAESSCSAFVVFFLFGFVFFVLFFFRFTFPKYKTWVSNICSFFFFLVQRLVTRCNWYSFYVTILIASIRGAEEENSNKNTCGRSNNRHHYQQIELEDEEKKNVILRIFFFFFFSLRYFPMRLSFTASNLKLHIWSNLILNLKGKKKWNFLLVRNMKNGREGRKGKERRKQREEEKVGRKGRTERRTRMKEKSERTKKNESAKGFSLPYKRFCFLAFR